MLEYQYYLKKTGSKIIKDYVTGFNSSTKSFPFKAATQTLITFQTHVLWLHYYIIVCVYYELFKGVLNSLHNILEKCKTLLWGEPELTM